jgi:hypothetical protein
LAGKPTSSRPALASPIGRVLSGGTQKWGMYPIRSTY